MGRISKDKRDIYYRKAKEDGYVIKYEYKLIPAIDTEQDLLTSFCN
jgi:23S rRNA U2552 (ribose-2'-O)-methylase RlmE/FtsJ